MPDTKITELRNLMTPMVNYFAMLKQVKSYPYMQSYLDEQAIQVNINMPRVREILSMIPDDACDI
jgi:hypothetical protein